MRWTHLLLVVILVVNVVQAGLALAAVLQGGARSRRGEGHLARYSRQHAQLLLVAGLALSVVPILGLVGAFSTRIAVWISIATELVAFTVARRALRGFELEAYGSPGSTSAAAPATAAPSAERASEPADS